MSNVIQISNTQRGFTRMDNELYEALIASNLSLKELRVAMAIHRLTAGYNREFVKVAALYIAKMLHGDESKAQAERANVSRAINSLIRQRVLYRAGGSRDPICFMPPNEWKVDQKSTVLKSTHCVENTPSSVCEITHIKERNTKPSTNVLVAADAATAEVDQSEKPEAKPKRADKIPYQQIADLYNRVCGKHLPECLKLNDKRRAAIRKIWNMELQGEYLFRDLDSWEGYFNDCLQSRHWTGNNDRGWRADIEFLCRESSVLKVLEAMA